MSATVQTRPEERAPRIRAIAEALLDAAPEALQELLEEAVRGPDAIEEGDVSATAYVAAQDVLRTFAPPAPEYDVGTQVVVRGLPLTGEVMAHFLNEQGEWEYSVRYNGTGDEQPHSRSELEPVSRAGA